MTKNKINIDQEPLDIICVACPKGCRLEARRKNGELLVANAGCKRGKDYAVGEINDPRRMVTSTVRVNDGIHPLAPVYTESPFPKGKINDLLQEISQVQLHAPVKYRQVIIKDALNTGINVLASRDLK